MRWHRFQELCLLPIDVFTPGMLLYQVGLTLGDPLTGIFVEHHSQEVLEFGRDELPWVFKLLLEDVLKHLILVS